MNNSSNILNELPTTRYQGSKRKIIPWIYENLKEFEFETVLDACGGSASVSYLFKKMKKKVTYNDNLKFNYLIGKALIENHQVRITSDDLIFVLDNSPKKNNLIQKYFKDVYFTQEENEWLDNVITNINLLEGNSQCETEYKRAICFYALFQSCLRKRPFNLFHRKNLYLRENNVKRSFGNKSTWEKKFEKEFIHFTNEANNLIHDSKIQCKSINESVFEIGVTEYDLVYLDIPYYSERSSNETSDYTKCYHFLEGISDYENWLKKIDFDTANLRFKKEFDNSGFDKKNINNSIDKLFKKFQFSIIVFSYKIGGIPSIDDIKEIMCRYKKNVFTEDKHYKYALNNQNGDARFNREVLIIGY